MSLIAIKIIGSLLISISDFYIAKRILNSKVKLFSITGIMCIFFMILPVCILYQEKYNSLVLLLTLIIPAIVFKKAFNINKISAIIVSGYAIILMTVIDLIGTSIELRFFTYNFIRTNTTIAIINNIYVSIIAFLISEIPFLKKKIRKLCNEDYKNNYLKLAIFIILIVVAISLLYYNVTTIFKLNTYYTVTLISIFIFIILSYFYIDENNNYQKLNNEYNILFEYIQNFENWIDDEQMYRHELKNNLSIIRNMTKNKKIINKIDEMLQFSIVIDEQAIEDLKNIPKGGLKGLLYYKIALAKNKRVKMIIEVSPKVSSSLKKIKEKHLRQLSIVLGIYLDNALESAEESKGKQVTLEVYEINNAINFVISNTYKNLISLKDMQTKYFSTKGGDHGKGLYYANKVLKKEKWLESSQIFLNEYFIQKITIKKFVK